MKIELRPAPTINNSIYYGYNALIDNLSNGTIRNILQVIDFAPIGYRFSHVIDYVVWKLL